MAYPVAIKIVAGHTSSLLVMYIRANQNVPPNHTQPRNRYGRQVEQASRADDKKYNDQLRADVHRYHTQHPNGQTGKRIDAQKGKCSTRRHGNYIAYDSNGARKI